MISVEVTISCDGKCGDCPERVAELRQTFHEALIAARDTASKRGWLFNPEKHLCPSCLPTQATKRERIKHSQNVKTFHPDGTVEQGKEGQS